MRKLTFTDRVFFAIARRVRLRQMPARERRGVLSITFDDIPRSACHILGQHGLRATYYLSGDLCGKVLDGCEYYRREDVAQIAAAGHEVGSHLFHHVSTLGLSLGQMRDEIARNDRFLKEVLGPDFLPQSFAYPYGEISLGAKCLCSRRFASSRSVLGGLNGTGADQDQLRILPIDNIFATTTDCAGMLEAAAREGSWVIALAHRVDDTGHAYSCPPNRLETVIRQAMTAGLDIHPVSGVLGTPRPA
jgi:peptidoglycan/xylan/chitin deacetylase (PgdA/CDA1 family)